MGNKCSYAWSGDIPCTGVYRCIYCGHVTDAHPLDYASVDRGRLCPAKLLPKDKIPPLKVDILEP